MTTPSTVSLNGIVVLSTKIGWLLDYTVNASDGNNCWGPIASIVNATNPLQLIVFEKAIIASGVFGGLAAIRCTHRLGHALALEKGSDHKRGFADDRTFISSLVISAPPPIAFSASPHPENISIPPWTDESSNDVDTPNRAVSTGRLWSGPPRELNGSVLYIEMG